MYVCMYLCMYCCVDGVRVSMHVMGAWRVCGRALHVSLVCMYICTSMYERLCMYVYVYKYVCSLCMYV